MLHLFISFQTSGPVNIRGNKTRVKVAIRPDVPPWEDGILLSPRSDRTEAASKPASYTSITYLASHAEVPGGEIGNYSIPPRNCITQPVRLRKRGPLTVHQAYFAKWEPYFPRFRVQGFRVSGLGFPNSWETQLKVSLQVGPTASLIGIVFNSLYSGLPKR